MPRHVLISRISILHKQKPHKGKQNTLDMIILMNKYIFYRGKTAFHHWDRGANGLEPLFVVWVAC